LVSVNNKDARFHGVSKALVTLSPKMQPVAKEDEKNY